MIFMKLTAIQQKHNVNNFEGGFAIEGKKNSIYYLAFKSSKADEKKIYLETTIGDKSKTKDYSIRISDLSLLREKKDNLTSYEARKLKVFTFLSSLENQNLKEVVRTSLIKLLYGEKIEEREIAPNTQLKKIHSQDITQADL